MSVLISYGKPVVSVICFAWLAVLGCGALADGAMPYIYYAMTGGSIAAGGDDVSPGDDWEHLMRYDNPNTTIEGLKFATWAQCQPNDPGSGPNVYDWSVVDANLAKAIPGKSRIGFYQMWGSSPDWAPLDTHWDRFEQFVQAQVTYINQHFGEIDIVFENEPNLSAGRMPSTYNKWYIWYRDSLAHFYKGVHAANAVTGINNKVIAANLSGQQGSQYVKLYQYYSSYPNSPSIKDNCDIIGCHPYPLNITDGVSISELATIRTTMEQYGDGTKQMYISEGWGSGRSAGFDRSSPLIEPTAQEVENMYLCTVKGWDNLMTPVAHWDPSYLWGLRYFTANDNWGAMNWRSRAVPQFDGSGNVDGFVVDGISMTPDIAPYFYNGGLYDFYGNSKDALHLVFPGNGLVFMNPGFELKSEPPRDNAPHFWTAEQEPPPSAVYSLDDVICHGGGTSLKLTQTASGSSGVYQTTAKRSVSPGTIYRAAVWCRTADVNGVAGRFYVRFVSLDGATKSDKIWAADVTGASDWTHAQVVATAPAFASRIEAGCYMAGVGTVWFDDVTIARADAEELGTVKGYTLNENQERVPHSIVTSTTGGIRAESDDNGYYEITGVPSGTYDFVCRKSGFTPFKARNQTVAAGKTTFVMFCMGLPKPGLTVTGVSADNSSAGSGEPVNVTATVLNSSQYPVNVGEVGLFVESGSQDVTPRFAIQPDPYNSRTIDAGSSQQFHFTLDPADSALGLAVSVNAYAYGQEDRPNMLLNGGFDDSVWNNHWGFTGSATLNWSADSTTYRSAPRSLKTVFSATEYTWNWANNYSAYGANAIPAKPHTNYTIGFYHKDSGMTSNASPNLFINEYYYDGSKWLYNGRRFMAVPKRSVWAHDCIVYETGDPSVTQGIYTTNRLVACFGPCTSSGASSGTMWGDDLYLKETGNWLADDRADSGAALLVPTTCASLHSAFDQQEGSAVEVSDLVVTAGQESFPDRFYVQNADRTFGTLVRLGSGSMPDRGETVSLAGVVGSFDGEPALVSASVTETGSPSLARAVGVSASGLRSPQPLSRAVLIRTWGRVTSVSEDSSSFFIGDGSGEIEVRRTGTVAGIPAPNKGDFVLVTAIASRDSSGSRTVLRPRGPGDVQTVHQ